MVTINKDVREYIRNKLCDFTNEHIRQCEQAINNIYNETRELIKNIESKLPKIKNIKIRLVEDSSYYHNRRSVYGLQLDAEEDIFIEMKLDTSKQSKEWLDQRIDDASIYINTQADNMVEDCKKNFTLLKRRLYRLKKSYANIFCR